MGHQISRHLYCPIFKHFDIWFPILICLYLGSQISYRKVVLQTKLWIPPFQWIMSQPSSMFAAREIKQKLRFIFFLDALHASKNLGKPAYMMSASVPIFRYVQCSGIGKNPTTIYQYWYGIKYFRQCLKKYLCWQDESVFVLMWIFRRV